MVEHLRECAPTEVTEDYTALRTTRGCNGSIPEKQLEKNQRIEGAGAMQTYVASKQQTRKSIFYVRNGLIRAQTT